MIHVAATYDMVEISSLDCIIREKLRLLCWTTSKSSPKRRFTVFLVDKLLLSKKLTTVFVSTTIDTTRIVCDLIHRPVLPMKVAGNLLTRGAGKDRRGFCIFPKPHRHNASLSVPTPPLSRSKILLKVSTAAWLRYFMLAKALLWYCS